jgi:8-oxo-dGTP diphosphatase
MPLERPILAVDVVLLHAAAHGLLVLLHRRTEAPFARAMALPGVAVTAEETLEAAARRALVCKAGLQPEQAQALHLEQVATFDALYRDPRGRTVSVAYLALTRHALAPGARAHARWCDARGLQGGSLPFDHGSILDTTVERLRGKLRYTNIASRLLPETFRLEELQAVYEAILGGALNRSNFRTKLLKIGLIERAGVMTASLGAQGGRPPHLFRFTNPRLAAAEREFV